MIFCKKCHDSAVDMGLLEAVKKLASKGLWICPWSKEKCGKASE